MNPAHRTTCSAEYPSRDGAPSQVRRSNVVAALLCANPHTPPTCRCPGCDPAALAAHLAWLSEMGGHLRALVKGGALVLAGTEGYFTPQASGARGDRRLYWRI